MKVFDMVKWQQSDEDQVGRHEPSNAKWVDGPDSGHFTPQLLDWNWVVDVRLANFYAEPHPKTSRCCGRLRRCLYGTRQAARSWQFEIEKGIKVAGIVMVKMSKFSFTSPCGKLVGVVHGDYILLAGPRSLAAAVRRSLRRRCETREEMVGV